METLSKKLQEMRDAFNDAILTNRIRPNGVEFNPLHGCFARYEYHIVGGVNIVLFMYEDWCHDVSNLTEPFDARWKDWCKAEFEKYNENKVKHLEDKIGELQEQIEKLK